MADMGHFSTKTADLDEKPFQDGVLPQDFRMNHVDVRQFVRVGRGSPVQWLN